MSAGPAVHVYCIDGTNVVRGAYGYAGSSAFQEQEEADTERFVEMLCGLSERLGSRVEIELYFDGPVHEMPSAPSNFSVRFTHQTPADDMILGRVRSRSYSGGGITVVTGDVDLGRQVDEEGGKWLRVRPGAAFETILAAIDRKWSR